MTHPRDRGDSEDRGPLRVLLVEDVQADAELVVRYLEKWGYQLTWDRVDELAAMEERLRRGGWDLVLADYSLPGFFGFEALEVAAEADADLPVIMVSGTMGEDLAVDAMRAGARDYIMKTNLKRLGPAVDRELREAKERAERRSAEEKLLRSQERWRAAFETSPDSIAINRLVDGLYVDVNEGFHKLTGYRREEVLGKTTDDIGIWAREKDRRRLLKAFETEGYADNLRAQFRLKGGSIRVGLISARVIQLNGLPHILSITRDIHEWAQRQMVYRILTENVVDVIWRADRDLVFTYVSPSVEGLLGYSPEEIRGKKLTELMPEERGKRATAASEALFAGKMDGSFTAETELFRKSGGTVPCEITVSVLEDPEGERTSLVGVTRDITKRLELEEQLRQSQKMEAIGTLAGGVAHDFNNLLTSILGYADLLKLESQPGDVLAESSEMIRQAATRAAQLTKQLLGFARRGKIKVVPVELHRVIREVVGILRRTVDKRIVIETLLTRQDVFVEGDPGQIHQVLMNLAVNACDAMAGVGTLTLSTEVVHGDEGRANEKEISAERWRRKPSGEIDFKRDPKSKSSPVVRLQVKDSGPGIPRDLRDRVFEPFFTTKPRGKGTGLGLSTVYGIVQNHGGELELQSEVGRGTIFTVSLPLTQRRAVTGERPSVPLGGTGRVLVVDDEETVRRVVSRMLEIMGYDATVVKSGDEAVRVMKSVQKPLDLVILDWSMPGMSGQECFKELRSLDPRLRVLIASGHAVDGIPEETLEALGVGFVQKPFSVAALSQAIAQVAHLGV